MSQTAQFNCLCGSINFAFETLIGSPGKRQAAYAEIYRRHHGLLFIYANKKLNDKEAAKDLISEIFLTLWNNRESQKYK
ncbi:MAG: sigma factor [Bacteroidota bacterium]